MNAENLNKELNKYIGKMATFRVGDVMFSGTLRLHKKLNTSTAYGVGGTYFQIFNDFAFEYDLKIEPGYIGDELIIHKERRTGADD